MTTNFSIPKEPLMIVTKRTGKQEPLDMEKANRVLLWACQGIQGVSASDIAMKAVPKLYDGVHTTELSKSFVQAAEELIPENHHYAEVQSRLLIVDLLKRVYGDWDTIKPLSQVVQENTIRGFYDVDVFNAYTPEEWSIFDSMIDHQRDYLLMGAGVKQFTDKYLTQDRSTNTVYETPQVAYALCAIAGLMNYPKHLRIAHIKKTYNSFSKGKVSLPTPVLAGVRQANKQYSSCVLIDVGDNLDSINEASKACSKMAAKRAGLGVNVGRLRPKKSKVGNGEVVHTGVVPFIRQFESAIKACSQGGIRDASATMYIPIWHTEIEDVLTLKSPKTIPENAVRRLDYGIQWDSFLKRRAAKNETMTLFSPHECKDLYEAFFMKDRSIFEKLYVKYEKDTTLKFRKQVNARDLLTAWLTQCFETGRYYDFMADHVNTHSVFKKPIYMSNLCTEITLPTEPIEVIHSAFNLETMTAKVDYKGLVQLCILGAVNLGSINLDDPKDMEDRMDVLVVFLNELIDNQDYYVPQALHATKKYRPLGIGVINLAYFYAKNNVKVDDEKSLSLTHRLGEQMYYFSLKASNKYAKLKGHALPSFDELIYSDGKTLLDTYCKNVDELTNEKLHMDWGVLNDDIKKYGVYNSTLLAYMPSESSSVVLNGTSGVDMIRSLITAKVNKKISFKQVAPEANKLKDRYDMLWDLTPKRFEGYIKNMAVLQKFCCQTISTNFSYNPDHFRNEDPKKDKKVDITAIMNHTFLATKYGLKTRYYVNTKGEVEDSADKISNEQEATAVVDDTEFDDGGCAGGACKI